MASGVASPMWVANTSRLPVAFTCGPAPEPWIFPSSRSPSNCAVSERAFASLTPFAPTLTASLATASVVTSICSTISPSGPVVSIGSASR